MMSLVPAEHWDYTFTDTIRGLRTALSARIVGTESYIPIPELGSCIPVRSARAAIVVALKALSLRAGARVAVPLYCCPVVFSAIKAAGCRACFIDVDPETYCISAADLAAKSSQVSAVIAVHMFGNVCDVPALRQAAPGKPLVEDCAQALGSCLGGKVAGSFGEVAVFSFRSGKYVSAGEGGAIYCREPDLESRASRLVAELSAPGRASDCIHVVKTHLRSLLRRKPLWGLIGSRLWSAYGEKVRFESQAPIVMGQIHASDRDTAVRRISSLDSCISRQRSNANYYSRNLAVEPGMVASETSGAFFNRLQYPLLVPTSQQCDELSARLRKEQIGTARPYKDIVSIAAENYGYAGDCPQAERIARTVLVIPCNYSLRAVDLDRIASSVNRSWAEIGGRHGVELASVRAQVANTAENQNAKSIPASRHVS